MIRNEEEEKEEKEEQGTRTRTKTRKRKEREKRKKKTVYHERVGGNKDSRDEGGVVIIQIARIKRLICRARRAWHGSWEKRGTCEPTKTERNAGKWGRQLYCVCCKKQLRESAKIEGEATLGLQGANQLPLANSVASLFCFDSAVPC